MYMSSNKYYNVFASKAILLNITSLYEKNTDK